MKVPIFIDFVVVVVVSFSYLVMLECCCGEYAATTNFNGPRAAENQNAGNVSDQSYQTLKAAPPQNQGM